MEITEGYIYATCGCVEDATLYILDGFHSMLLAYNIEDFSYKVLEYDFELCSGNYNGVTGMFKFGTRLFFVFRNNKRAVATYNLESCETHLFRLDNDSTDDSLTWSFQIIDSLLYVFPYDLDDGILCYDLTKNCYLKTIHFCKENYINETYNGMHWGEIFLTDDYLYVFHYKSDVVSKFTKDGFLTDRFSLPDAKKRDHVEKSGNAFWITTFDDDILRLWKPETGVIKEYAVHGIHRRDDAEIIIRNIEECGDSVVLIPFIGKTISCVDLENGRELLVDLKIDTYKTCVESVSGQLSYCCLNETKRILLLPKMMNCFISIDIKTGCKKLYNSRICTEDLRLNECLKILRNRRESIVKESIDINLKTYVEAILL